MQLQILISYVPELVKCSFAAAAARKLFLLALCARLANYAGLKQTSRRAAQNAKESAARIG